MTAIAATRSLLFRPLGTLRRAGLMLALLAASVLLTRPPHNFDYEAFGGSLGAGAAGTDYLFGGEQLDRDLEKYFLRARYLESRTGSFLTFDDFSGDVQSPASLHKYVFAHQSPVQFSDPSGNSVFGSYTVVASIVGVIALSAIVNVGHLYDSMVGGATITAALSGFAQETAFDSLVGIALYPVGVGAVRLGQNVLAPLAKLFKLKKAVPLPPAFRNWYEAILSKARNVGPVYENTALPKYFEWNVAGQRLYITQNATKHFYELIKGKPGASGEAATGLILEEIDVVLAKAFEQGVKWGRMMNVSVAGGEYQVVIQQTSTGGPLPAVTHLLRL